MFGIPLLILIAAYVFLLALFGRVVVVVFSAKQGRNVLLNPLAGVLVALGLWQLLMMVALAFNLPLTYVAWGFGGVGAVLSIVWVRNWPGFKGRELDWLLPLVLCAVLYALWPILLADAPSTVDEFQTLYALPAALVGDTRFGLDTLRTLPASWSLFAPLWFGLQSIQWGAVAVLNLGLVILIAGALLQATNMRLRWSNLPLLAGGSLLGITVLNPFFTPDLVVQLSPVLLGAAGLLVACLPLVQPLALPRGMAVVPAALVAVVPALTAPVLWLPLLVVWGLWVVRQLILEPQPPHEKRTTVSGLVILIMLPVVSVLAWKILHINATVWTFVDIPHGWLFARAPWLVYAALLALAGLVIWRRQALKSWRANALLAWVLAHYPLIVPLCLGVVLAVEGALPYGQFVLLIPAWRLWAAWYAGSSLKQACFARPWHYGGGVLLVLVALILAGGGLFKTELPLAARHAYQVQQHLAGQTLPDNMRIATVGSNYELGAGAALRYFNLPTVGTQAADALFHQAESDRAYFHALLKQAGYTHVWVHSPDADTRALFLRNLRSDYSYLFALTGYSFQLVKGYPHLAYKGAGWE